MHVNKRDVKLDAGRGEVNSPAGIVSTTPWLPVWLTAHRDWWRGAAAGFLLLVRLKPAEHRMFFQDLRLT